MRSLISLARAAFIAVAVAASVPALPAQEHPATPAWAAVDAVLGRPGTAQPGGVIKFSFPRGDLAASIDGVVLKPALALGGWIAFKELAAGSSMMMGDLVLTEDEVSPVMRTLQAGGVEQTALHNHVLASTPRLMYMHIEAHGDPVQLARVVRDALAKTRTPAATASPTVSSATLDLDTAGVARALGATGRLNGGVYQVSVPRRETILEMGVEVPPSMGVATAINFQPTGGGKAAITGDFVLRGTEVNPVIRALHAHGIEVTAVHSHMLDEEPRLFFMHFWANRDAVALARGLRAALELTGRR